MCGILYATLVFTMSYALKAAAIAREISLLERDTTSAPATVAARLASLRRSLDWYQSRIRRIEVLGVHVGDTIETTSSAG